MRYVYPDGRRRLGFLDSALAEFSALNKDRVERTATFKQLSDEEKKQIVELARTLSRNAILRRHSRHQRPLPPHRRKTPPRPGNHPLHPPQARPRQPRRPGRLPRPNEASAGSTLPGCPSVLHTSVFRHRHSSSVPAQLKSSQNRIHATTPSSRITPTPTTSSSLSSPPKPSKKPSSPSPPASTPPNPATPTWPASPATSPPTCRTSSASPSCLTKELGNRRLPPLPLPPLQSRQTPIPPQHGQC